jgi:hypothetical protein
VQRSRRDPVLAADALLALQALEVPELQRLATGARSSSEPELRVAALAAARRAPLGECETWARALSSDREGAVRLEAIECLETLGTRGAAEALVERLEKEERQGIRCRVLDALQSLSGYKYRFDVRPWKEWLATCPLEWRAGPRALKPAAVESLTRAQGLSALEVQGDRVAFLFDFSGSMWMPLPDGRTPKEVVDVELRAALERLPETVEFNLVPYNQEPHPWQDAVVSAKKANVRAALDFFERCNLHGRGNVWDAMLVALADPAVDNIVVLTDGYPTGGRHADMELVAPLFGHANRYRKVRLDAVLVDANYRGSAQWSELARSTGGTCLEVALRR